MLTYCDRIISSAPDIPKDKALRALRPWQNEVQTTGESLTVAAENTPLTRAETKCIHALYARHVRQIEQIIHRLHDREVKMNSRSVLTVQDLQAEGYRLFRLALASYTHEYALSTHVHTVTYTRMSNVLRDARKRDTTLEEAASEGQGEPPASTYVPELPVGLDLADIAEEVIDDRPPKEHRRLRTVWDRLRNPG